MDESIQNAADVINTSLTNLLCARHDDLSSDTVKREQLLNQSPIYFVADEMATWDASATSGDGTFEAKVPVL